MIYLHRKQMEFNLIRRKNLWLKLINNYSQMIFFHKARLKTVAISLGYDCQCACVHCSAAKLNNKARKRLSLVELLRAVEESITLGAIHFNITGGEPLLYKECLELMAYISGHKRSIISLATNGILLSSDCAYELKKSGLDVVQISLDSYDENNHDRKRGYAGAYQKALEGVKNAKKAGLIVFLSAVVSNENLLNGEITKLALVAKELGVILHLNSACSVGRWEGESFYLKPEAKTKLADLLSMHFVRENTEAGYFTKGCKAGKEKIYISAYGDVLPCPFIQISFGNLKEESLAKIWHEMIKVPYFNNISKECLASQNCEFILHYLRPLSEIKQMPHPYELLKQISRLDEKIHR